LGAHKSPGEEEHEPAAQKGVRRCPRHKYTSTRQQLDGITVIEREVVRGRCKKKKSGSVDRRPRLRNAVPEPRNGKRGRCYRVQLRARPPETSARGRFPPLRKSTSSGKPARKTLLFVFLLWGYPKYHFWKINY
jgi:hypothetical protein